LAGFDELDRLGDAMGKVYAACHDRILVNLARHFRFLKPGETPGGAFDYQAHKLAEMGQVTRESMAIIRETLGGADAELVKSLEAAILDAIERIEPELRQAAEAGLIGTGAPAPALSPRMTRAFQLYYRQAADALNLVNTRMLESTQEAYRETVADIASRMRRTQATLNAATGQVVTGVESFNAAQRLAVADMAENGITGYVDHNGRKWKPETYVAMVMRTTHHNVSREAFWEANEQYGNDLYLVSQHPGARPLCYPWQCKVISRTNDRRWVTDGAGQPVQVWAQDETSYGQAAGLFGINCGHHPELFIPGATKVPALRQGEEENAQTYAQSQRQRGLEREFRKARLDMAVAKAQGDEEGLEAARARLKAADEKLERFAGETGRKRRKEREYEPVKATWPGENGGQVTRFGGDEYIDAGKAPPQKGAFAPASPSSGNVASQATQTTANVVQSTVPDSIEQAIGVKKGQPYNIGEARTWANQDYNTGKWEYKANCQRCVQAYELRRRGYDVEAMPKVRRGDNVNYGSEIFNGYGASIADAAKAYTFQQTEAQVKQELMSAPEGARYSIYIQWKNSKESHAFIAEKVNGSIQYLDPQSNKRDVSDYFARGQAGRFGFFRMDDKPIATDGKIITAAVRKGQRYGRK